MTGWQDAWMDETIELVVGCVLLVLSGIYWWTGSGPVWQDWQTWLSTSTVFLGPWFVYRAWKRREVKVVIDEEVDESFPPHQWRRS